MMTCHCWHSPWMLLDWSQSCATRSVWLELFWFTNHLNIFWRHILGLFTSRSSNALICRFWRNQTRPRRTLSDSWVKYSMFDWVSVLCVGKWASKTCETPFIFAVLHFKRFGIRTEWWRALLASLGYRRTRFGGEEWSSCLAFEIQNKHQLTLHVQCAFPGSQVGKAKHKNHKNQGSRTVRWV